MYIFASTVLPYMMSLQAKLDQELITPMQALIKTKSTPIHQLKRCIDHSTLLQVPSPPEVKATWKQML